MKLRGDGRILSWYRNRTIAARKDFTHPYEDRVDTKELEKIEYEGEDSTSCNGSSRSNTKGVETAG